MSPVSRCQKILGHEVESGTAKRSTGADRSVQCSSSSAFHLDLSLLRPVADLACGKTAAFLLPMLLRLPGTRSGRYRVLVPTDLAARGIDIEALPARSSRPSTERPPTLEPIAPSSTT